MNNLKLPLVIFFSLILAACEHPEQIRQKQAQASIDLAVSHPVRPNQDVKRDQIRNPSEVLKFFDIKKGDRVLELMASGGYYTELLSHCVGQSGTVFMQNNQQFYDFQTDKAVNARLMDNRLANVKRWDRELSDLKIADNSIDKLLMILVLHDFYWMEKDVTKIIQQSFNALKPGGTLGIVDHAAEEKTGITHARDMKGIHRIEQQHVIKTMVDNGFVFSGLSDALRQPNDDRTKAFFSLELKGKSTDRFMLRFTKPGA
jgi:predicted methyltransferase